MTRGDKITVAIVVVMLVATIVAVYIDKSGLKQTEDYISPEEEAYWDGYNDGYGDGLYDSGEKEKYVIGKLKHLLEVLHSTDMYGGDKPFDEVIDAVTDDIYDALSELEKSP